MSKSDPRYYDVNRDVAHHFSYVANLVASRLEDQTWDDLNVILKQNDITMDDLGEACGAFCTFVGSAAEDAKLSMKESLDKSGWTKVKPAAQIAVMSTIGAIYFGIQFAGVRAATIGDEGPMHEMAYLIEQGRKSADIIMQTRWQRAWSGLKSRLGVMLGLLKRDA